MQHCTTTNLFKHCQLVLTFTLCSPFCRKVKQHTAHAYVIHHIHVLETFKYLCSAFGMCDIDTIFHTPLASWPYRDQAQSVRGTARTSKLSSVAHAYTTNVIERLCNVSLGLMSPHPPIPVIMFEQHSKYMTCCSILSLARFRVFKRR